MNPTDKLPALRTFGGLICALFLILPTGCHTVAGSGSFASVVINNHSVQEIATTTSQVFTADGYMGGMTGPNQMVFQKQGSMMNTMAYGGVGDAYNGAMTMTRVKLEIVDLSAGSRRLQGEAFVVKDAGD